jgi:hypothetical protein
MNRYRFTWSLIKREEQREILSTIFGPERETVTGGCGKLNNEDLHNL